MKRVSEVDTYLTNVSLYFDEGSCRSCGICEDVCPKEAIELGPVGPISKGLTDLLLLSVDEDKCSLCGVCDAVCPFGAFRLEINGERKVPVLDLRGFPKLVKKVELDDEKCELIGDCVKACPTDAIEIEGGGWKIDMDHCVTCPWCEDACPNDAIKVTKMFEGKIDIDASKCPGGCASCLEVCPVNAIYEPKPEEPWGEADRIAADERYCIYCGACVLVCPVSDAIKVERNRAEVEEVKSLLWDTSQEKLLKEIKSVEEG